MHAPPPRQRAADRRRARAARPRLVAVVGRRAPWATPGARRAGAPPARLGRGGALAVLAAVMAAGLFEYNFGDSEVLMLHAARLRGARIALAGASAPAAGGDASMAASSPGAPPPLLRSMRGPPRARAGRRDARRVHLGPGGPHLARRRRCPVVEVTGQSFHLGRRRQRGRERPRARGRVGPGGVVGEDAGGERRARGPARRRASRRASW